MWALSRGSSWPRKVIVFFYASEFFLSDSQSSRMMLFARSSTCHWLQKTRINISCLFLVNVHICMKHYSLSIALITDLWWLLLQYKPQEIRVCASMHGDPVHLLMYLSSFPLVQTFFWTFAQKLKVKKTKTQAQKTQEFFAQNSKFRQMFQKFWKIFNQFCNIFLSKIG